MQISKELDKRVLRNYFFIKGHIDIDCNYFIEKIKKGVEEQNNMNHRTNIKGKMTSWKFFNNDINFIKPLIKFNKHVDQNYDLPSYTLKDSWGFINSLGEKTDFHSHYEAIYSGVISGWLTHGNDTNDTDIEKFGLSFNMCSKHPW